MLKVKKDKAIILLAIIILITMAVTMYIYSQKICETRKIDMFVIVSDHIGVDVSDESLRFGMIIPGGDATRTINISHKCRDNTIVNLKRLGDIAKFISLPKNNFILEPNKIEKLDISVNIPKDTEFRNYTGMLLIKFKEE